MSVTMFVSLFFFLLQNGCIAVKPDLSKACHAKSREYSLDNVQGCCCSGTFVNSTNITVGFWTTSSISSYLFTLALLFLASLVSPCIKNMREQFRNRMLKKYVGGPFVSHLLLFMIALFTYILDFMIMLIIMGFNVGVFISITAGYAAGYVLSSPTICKHNMLQSDIEYAHTECH
ncbi:uncharacterized protein BEWA_000860 [Theileria equi strain WA]|uniref:Membrane protein, putative n=1 Tax=Theileria equi strain WA TaxID=1537102 RepID=L0B089_THEEQ|nr:uncharacterized protein BEWA_000860 [Theileria equi strain WA]AFZ80681.1 membrane protein, putative [Theileria equi strain WA]|eukprot:XP_004830347.1 uncharacterized protein BEWA_000860 [Theileria equi strain WA]